MEKGELSSRILRPRQFHYPPSKRYDLNTQPAPAGYPG